MAEYKPKFNAELPWSKVLELMNQLLDHKTDSSSSCGEVEYILSALNDDTKEILNRLGIKLENIDNDFYDEEEEWIDITTIVWGEIIWHYGREIWYTGEKFVPWDEEKNELLKTAKEVIVWHVNTPDYFDKTEGFGKDLDKLKNVIRKIEGDTE